MLLNYRLNFKSALNLAELGRCMCQIEPLARLLPTLAGGYFHEIKERVHRLLVSLRS